MRALTSWNIADRFDGGQRTSRDPGSAMGSHLDRQVHVARCGRAHLGGTLTLGVTVPVRRDDELRTILETVRTIAVVGASGSPQKDAHEIPAYLQEQGYRVLPVNPARDEILGREAADGLRELDDVDVVDVFRPSDETPDIARAAVDIGASVLWLQLGITSDEAARIAEDAGLMVVMDECMGATHRRLGIVGAPAVG